MLEITHNIRNLFSANQDRITTFSEYDVRVESWFKGELLYLLHQLKDERIINDFQREVPVNPARSRRRVDFEIRVGKRTHLCELKSMCISQKQQTPRNLNYYFRDDKNGIIKDFRKLEAINGRNRWVLAFVYPKPSVEVWQGAISRIPNELNHWRCISVLEDYPPCFFISLWKRQVARG
jgi:hypothetical protein